MGAEGSKLDGEQEEEQKITLTPGGEHQSPPHAQRRQSQNGSSASKTQWMRPSQSRTATAAEIRSPAAKQPQVRSTVPGQRQIQSARPSGRSTAAGPPPAPEPPPPEPTPEQEYKQRVDGAKKQLVSKLAVQIKSIPMKETINLTPPRPPVAKQSSMKSSSQEGKRSWLSKLMKNKAATLEQMGDRLAKGAYLEPMSQQEVGDRVEGSLGNNLEQFGTMQGALHDIVQQGVSDEVLDRYFFAEEEERAMPTYQKWQIIRHAAEQVLAVYANRSNSQWIEDEQWGAPNVVNTTAVSASMYSSAVDAALTQGNIALLFIDDGRLAEMGGDDVSPLVATDLWQAIKELAPHKVPSGQRLERLSVAGRHLLHAAVSVEMWYGASALKKIKVVLAIDCDCEYFVVNELQQWNFFGLHHSNVVLLPLPRFHGFAQDMRSGHLAHVKGSPRLMLGTGYAMFLLNSPAEAYTLSADGTEPMCLQGSVLEWLSDSKASWLYTGLFSDIERLKPEQLFDMDFLAAGLYAADRTGANMAMEVLPGEHEREARLHDSVVLSRLTRRAEAARAPGTASRPASAKSTVGVYSPPSTPGPSTDGRTSAPQPRVTAPGTLGSAPGTGTGGGGSGGGPGGGGGMSGPGPNCNLRVSSMRTVKSYQLLRQTAAAPQGFYISTHRYVFSIKALQRMLVDPSAFHADVYLQGFYAYATFDISDLTTFAHANCACLLSPQGLKGPVMSEVIYGKDWLVYSAGVLQLQDNVKEFRRKAVQLYDSGKAAATGPSKSSTYKEKEGYNVLLVLTPDHSRMVRAAIRMARLFVHNIVDRLHCVVVAQEAESKTRIREVLDAASDKELEFSGQLLRDVALRVNGAPLTDVVTRLVAKTKAHMVVVPSERLCLTGTSADLGQLAASAALALARAVTGVPLLIVKANTIGKYLYVPAQANTGHASSASRSAASHHADSSPTRLAHNGGHLQRTNSSASRDVVSAMVHLDSTSVGPLVEFVSGALAGGTDTLFLARTSAMERDGALSMRSRRVFVQARMAVAQALRTEERAYAGAAAVELPKAVEAEGVDLLALSCPPDLAISKETEQLLQLCRTSVLIHRAMTAGPPTAVPGAWS